MQLVSGAACRMESQHLARRLTRILEDQLLKYQSQVDLVVKDGKDGKKKTHDVKTYIISQTCFLVQYIYIYNIYIYICYVYIYVNFFNVGL